MDVLAQRETGDVAGGVANMFRAHPKPFNHRSEQIRDRRLALHRDVAASDNAIPTAPGKNRRQLIVRMNVAIGQPGSIADQRIIQQRPITVFNRLRLAQELGEELGVVAIDLRHFLQHLFVVLVVREGMESTYRSVKDLAGKRIAIYDDPAAERWVRENIPGAKISKFQGDNGWFEAVEHDQADALIYDYPFTAEEIKEHPHTVIAQYNLNQSKYTVAVPAGNYDLVYEVNAAIDKLRATPRYGELMREYLSSASAAFMKPVAGRKTYTVVAGDTLSKIAASQLKDQARWKDIWDLNRDRVANENLIYPRLVLLMP